MARKPDEGARDRILDTASRLFARYGVHAVGLQQIIDECGCGKNLLYREFRSKDELVVAFLERCTQDWDAVVAEAARPDTADPGREIVALVAAVAERAAEDGFRGCPLRNAYAEFPDETHPAHQVIVAHFTAKQAHLHDLAKRAGARDPEALSDRINLIIDGLNSNGAVLGRNGALGAAVRFAQDTVDAETR
ncbi:TetR/AcrR family transcriptional regulator [Actinomadura citrea]|uniref:TetR/AcrR family transcriptional regulator n=1 Tax=Actinomadura TaxID=1988 RepID=UPI002E298F86|nr:TetR/AcrR family transcriptional regulator [Actinomadura citrea]